MYEMKKRGVCVRYERRRERDKNVGVCVRETVWERVFVRVRVCERKSV